MSNEILPPRVKHFESNLARVLAWRDFGLPLEEVLAALPTLDDVRVPSGASVVVRADLDVPMVDNQIRDDARIEACLPTIRFASDSGWRVVVVGHIGRKGVETLAPVADELARRLERPVPLLSNWFEGGELSAEAYARVESAAPGDVLMLENLRQYPQETALWNLKPSEAGQAVNDVEDFARVLAGLGQLHVNECFAASNVDTSSTAAALLADQVALGKYISEELTQYVVTALRADFIVFSGAKANKLDDLESIVATGRVRTVIVAGSLAIALAMAKQPQATFGRASTDEEYVGFIDEARLRQAARIVDACALNGIDLVLPVDFVLDNESISESVPDGHAQLDVGPATRDRFRETVTDYVAKAQKGDVNGIIFYNGVFGKFEDARFSEGTRDFVSALGSATRAGVKTFVGGGEGRTALLQFGSLQDVTHAFTAGGTVLKLLSGNSLPYLCALYQNVSESESAPTPDLVEESTMRLIAQFEEENDLTTIERLADEVADLQLEGAIPALVGKLERSSVRDDDDAFDAVCGALVKLGAMVQHGNMNFAFLPSEQLPTPVRDLLAERRPYLPSTLFE